MTHQPLVRERLRLFGAGTAATLAMMAASRATRSPVMADLQDLAASAAAPPGSGRGELFGYAAQLLNGGLFALGYREAFHLFRLTPDWRSGLTLGLIHGAVAGIALAAVPVLHPRVPERVPPPGAFLRRRGAGSAAMLIGLHGLYGALIGIAIASKARRHSRDIPPGWTT